MSKRNRRIAIIGGGPGGICMGVKLREAGYDDLTIYELSDGIGGTWHRNRYPGLECDVVSDLYTFTFAPNPDWSNSYPPQPEILDYMRKVARDHDIDRHVHLNTGVTGARWDAAAQEWELTLSSGETARFDVIVGAVGMFGPLHWPDVPGREEFQGTLFHSGAWPSNVDLSGKTVSVIGTAASAVQFIPKIAAVAGKLQVFQRSPHWVLPKDIEHFDDEEKARRRERPEILAEARETAYCQLDAFCEWASFQDATQFEDWGRQNIAVVKDPALRERLTPKTSWGCTRPLISNEYYPVFNRTNVELIPHGVTRITKTGLVDATGVERSSDVIICATGFDVERFISVLPVHGLGGRSLDDAWAEGAQAYLGITTSGFPNMFMLYGPNTNNNSILWMIECQSNYVVRQLERMDREGVRWIDVRSDAMDAYNRTLAGEIAKVKIWAAGCHNYYSNAAGRIVTQYPHNMTRYKDDTSVEDWQVYHTEPAA
jgi:cation diffusion facilitator CzcD-associated flavoprotein CzcO